MKKGFLLLALLNVLPAFAEPKDFIVVLDLGPILESSRNNIMSVFLNVILKDYLKSQKLDEFHLIGMANDPRQMYRQIVFDKNEIENFLINLNRVPAETVLPDLPKTMNFTFDYIQSLANDKSKVIVLIMDGKSPGGSEEKKWKDSLERFLTQANRNRWSFKIALIPFDGAQPEFDLNQLWSSRLPVTAFENSPEFANRFLGSPRITFPSDLGIQGRNITFPIKVENFNGDGMVLKLNSVKINGDSVLDNPTTISVSPNSSKSVTLSLYWKNAPAVPGNLDLLVELGFEDNFRAFPDKVRLPLNYTGEDGGSISPQIVILIIVAILLVALMIFLFVRLVQHRAQPGHYVSPALARKRIENQRTASTARNASTTNATRTSSVATSISKQPSARIEKRQTVAPVSRSAPANLGSEENVYYLELWTDDFLFQNTAGGRGLFKFHDQERKVLGDIKGVPIRIQNTPALGEFYFENGKLWFKPLVEGCSFGDQAFICEGEEIIWNQHQKKSLHILMKRYVSEADKFKLFLQKLGKTRV